MTDKIKKLIEKENYKIILDTNVLLNVYRFSPGFSEFALNCLIAVQNHVILPATVYLEYEKNRKREFENMKKRITSAPFRLQDELKKAKNNLIKSCDTLYQLNYPDINILNSQLSTTIDGLNDYIKHFFEERRALNYVANIWDNNDYLEDFLLNLKRKLQVLESPSQLDIYNWCKEGEKRYKNNTPPGFCDAKNKDGVQKYSDLIIWKEIIRFAENNKKNILFVTDDVKSDWWERKGNELTFHSSLINEFSKTKQYIIACNSNMFYKIISDGYKIKHTDAVDLALNISDNKYFLKVQSNVFNYISYDLQHNGLEFINPLDKKAGYERIDFFNIISSEYLFATQLQRKPNEIVYRFTYAVELEGNICNLEINNSFSEEKKENDKSSHVFNGLIEVEVKRKVYLFLDYETDFNFDDAYISSGFLDEIPS